VRQDGARSTLGPITARHTAERAIVAREVAVGEVGDDGGMGDEVLERVRALCLGLDVPDVDWDAIAEHVTDAYRTVAPPRLAARLP
jgi:hypothetical protein